MVSGDWIFGNMPLLFLIGIAIGLARNNDGTAALAAVVGFITMNAALGKDGGVARPGDQVLQWC